MARNALIRGALAVRQHRAPRNYSEAAPQHFSGRRGPDRNVQDPRKLPDSVVSLVPEYKSLV